jgi:hypothetical protein
MVETALIGVPASHVLCDEDRNAEVSRVGQLDREAWSRVAWLFLGALHSGFLAPRFITQVAGKTKGNL